MQVRDQHRVELGVVAEAGGASRTRRCRSRAAATSSPSSTRYPLQAPPASCHDGDLPSTVIRIVTINSNPPTRRRPSLQALQAAARRPSRRPGPGPRRRYRQAMARCAHAAARGGRRRPLLRRLRRAPRRAAGRRAEARRRWSSPTSWARPSSPPSLDPEELRQRLAPFFEVARATLEEHGGTVEKYVGDAVMAVFGVPRAYGDDPDRAVAAALALRDRVGGAGRRALAPRRGRDRRGAGARARRRPLGHRRGGQRGGPPAAGGRPRRGPGRRASGARLPRRASSRTEARSTRRAFRRRSRAWRAVAGERAEAAGDDAASWAARTTSTLLRLVYRRAARERVPELVTVTGEAGDRQDAAGRRAGRRAARAGPDPPRCSSAATRRTAAGSPSGRSARSCAPRPGPAPTTRSATSTRRSPARLAGLGADDADELAAALGIALGGDPIDGDVEDALKHAWRRLVALLAGERPLVVIGIDDAHWADDGLLDLIEEVAFSARRAPAAPPLHQPARSCSSAARASDVRARNVTQIELRPLAGERSTELALAAPARCVAASWRRGSPRPRAAIRSSPRRWRAGSSEDPDAALRRTPPGDRPGGDRRATRSAAGRGEARDPVRRCARSRLPRGGSRRPARASRRPRSWPPWFASHCSRSASPRAPGRYAFRHQLIRDVAYASLPRAERASLHERAAEGIRRRAGRALSGARRAGDLPPRCGQTSLGPTDARGQTAREASLEAAEIAARAGRHRPRPGAVRAVRGAAPGAIGSERRHSIAAAGVALQRLARRRVAAAAARDGGRSPSGAGEARLAAGAYARAVEVVSRMGGITGDLPEEELQAMLDRGRALVPDDDKVTRARLLLDEAWIVVAPLVQRGDGRSGSGGARAGATDGRHTGALERA